MSTVTITIATIPVALPLNTTSGPLRVSIYKDEIIYAQQDVDGTEAVFEAVEDGDYSASAQRLDANNNDLGTPVVTVFSVGTDEATTYDAPSGLTVRVE